MKLKYYLRGMGIGIILTAIVMGFALGGRKSTISDAQVIERAKELGMIDPSSGVLSSGTGEDKENEASEIASDTTLDETREEISEEINEAVAETSEPVSGVVEAPEERKTDDSETEQSSDSGEQSEKETENVTEQIDTEIGDNTPETSESDVQQEVAATDNNQQEEADAGNIVETVIPGEPQNPVSSTSSETKTVTIPGGMSSDGVAQVLYNAGVIDNAASFNRYLIDRGMDRVIRSGTKVIPAGSGYEEIANIICK
jgi:hypothetical protein